MDTQIPGLPDARCGETASGVPFVALAPAAAEAARALVVLWHGADPPRSPEALAGAVPLQRLPAWRVYLGMPLYGRRSPPGGFAEILRRGAEDAVRLVYQPSIGGAVAELPAALDDIRAQLGIALGLPLGLFGFSQGGAAALLALSQQQLPVRAAVTFGAVIDLPGLVDTLAGVYGITYEWTAERRAIAEQLSALHRASALAASGAAVLLAAGEHDRPALREPAQQLAAAIRAAGGTAKFRLVPEVAHAFVGEPGEAAMPQGPLARAIDGVASEWFHRYLV